MAVRRKILHDVFISYAHRDAARAAEICAALEADGLHCWMAPRDIRSGVPYAQALVDAIAGSRIVVIVFSEAANQSGGVLNELEIAFNRGKPMLAVRIEACEPSGSAEFYLRRHQWFDAIDRLDASPAAMSRAIRDALSASAARRSRGPKRGIELGHELPERSLVMGRDAELAWIAETLAAALRGSGSLLLLTGEPGIGKTRILEAALDEAVSTGFAVAFATNFEHARAPLGPWVDILRTLQDVVPSIVPESSADRSAFHHLLGVGDQVEMPDRRRLFVIVAEALERASQHRPIFLSVDDAQWADPETAELLDFVAPRLATSRIALAVARRAGNAGPASLSLSRLERYPTVTVRDISRLSDEAVRQIIAAMPAEDRLKGGTVEEICRRSDGNPLFAVSLARDAVTGSRQLLPQSVHLSVVSRLDALSRPDARVIEAAAVIGRVFSLDDLIAVSGEDRGNTLSAIRAARDVGLVEESGTDGTTFAFCHELFRASAYEMLLSAERRDLHRAIAERRSSDAKTPSALLAYHWQRAGSPDKACHYAIAAADDAMHLNAYGSARDAYLDALGTGTLSGADEAALRAKAAAAYDALGDAAEAAHQFAAVVAYYRGIGDTENAASYELSFSSNAYRAGRGDDLVRSCDRVLSLSVDAKKRFGAHATLASFYAFRGSADLAREHIAAADGLGPIGQLRDVISVEWARAASSSDETGKESLAAARRAVALAERNGSPPLYALNLMNFAIDARRSGHEEEAVSALELAVQIADENGVTYTASYARCFQARILHFHGALREAFNVVLHAASLHVDALIVRLFVASVGLNVLADLGMPDRLPALRDAALLDAAFEAGEEARFAPLAAAHVQATALEGDGKRASILIKRALGKIDSFHDVSDALVTFARFGDDEDLAAVDALLPERPGLGPRGLHHRVITAIVAARRGLPDAGRRADEAAAAARAAKAPLFEAIVLEFCDKRVDAENIYRTIGARGQLARLMVGTRRGRRTATR